MQRVEPLRHDDTVAHAARRIAEMGSGLPVVDDARRLVGYLGERDLLRAITPGYLRELRDTDFFTRDLSALARCVAKAAPTSVSEHMSPKPAFVDIDDSETHAAELFIHGAVRSLAVVEGDGEVIGILRLGDLIRDLIASVESREPSPE
jgi:CBS domain-containing protein